MRKSERDYVIFADGVPCMFFYFLLVQLLNLAVVNG